MNSIVNFLSKNKGSRVRIAVIGDAMIDEYYSVKVTRISPEFPNQIMHSLDWKPATQVPGGSANVCKQMEEFNVDCFLISFTDRIAKNVLDRESFDTDYCVDLTPVGGHVPMKRRFYDGDYPLPRWDIESPLYGLSKEDFETYRNKLYYSFVNLVEKHKIDVVILSDYGKGVFNGDSLSCRIIMYCNHKGIKTVVDPKGPPLSRWSACTIIKPNAFEAVSLGGLDPLHHHSLEERANAMRHILNCKTVVVTDSSSPPVYRSMDSERKLQLSRKADVQSVVGAGDCFCAFLSMAVAHKMSHADAIEIAWNASSRYVENKHNKPLSPYELARWNDPIAAKLVTVEDLQDVMKRGKHKWVWTNGCFDVVHAGHLKTLILAKSLGDRVIVGLNTDESIKRLKGSNRPVLNYQQRAEHLAHLEYVDFVLPIEDDTPLNIVQKLKPNKIVKGGDYKVEQIAGWDVVGRDNVHLVPLVPGLSTTKIIERIQGG